MNEKLTFNRKKHISMDNLLIFTLPTTVFFLLTIKGKENGKERTCCQTNCNVCTLSRGSMPAFDTYISNMLYKIGSNRITHMLKIYFYKLVFQLFFSLNLEK